ncbi:MAG: lipoprotein insertase outer membrane protein LolB [Ramlibacter sp.]
MLAGGQNDNGKGVWAGRLGLQVESSPPQSFSAGFELKGNPKAGELALFNPLGGTLAVLSWDQDSATLRSGSQTSQFESLDALVSRVAGTAIPVAALFDWLAGTNTPVAGWQADLSQLAQGRIRAQRMDPAPAADLRLALER